MREKTIQDRKFRAPPTLPTARATTMESLIFPTSGPYATLGAFHPSSTSKITGSKTSKVSSLPAPPFVFPSIGLRTQIREAALHNGGGPSNSGSAPAIQADGSVAERPRILKRRLEDDSDSDEVTFVGASSSKGKNSREVQPTPPTAAPQSSPKSDVRRRKRPVDMDFFSVPSPSVSTSRHSGRKSSVPSSSSVNAPADDVWAGRSTGEPSTTYTNNASNRPEAVTSRASVNWARTASSSSISAQDLQEGSRNRRNPSLFVPKRRKVH